MSTSSEHTLAGKVAVVTGASRGVGRGVALTLGERGATVYVTGRTTQGDNGTIGETAERVTQRGGRGIAVPVDHTQDDQVADLFERVRQEQGKLDILVHNVWGGYENMENYQAPFWEQPLWRWDKMFATGARAHFVSSKFGVPLMDTGGLIVNTSYADLVKRDSDWGDWGHIVNIAKGAVNDLTRVMAFSLRERGVAVVSVAPTGFVYGLQRTQRIREALRTSGGIATLYRTEQPDGETSEYTGRAVAALAMDVAVMARSGQILVNDELADLYGFTDIDGRKPRLSY